MYVNIIIYSNKLLSFVWSKLKKRKKKTKTKTKTKTLKFLQNEVLSWETKVLN